MAFKINNIDKDDYLVLVKKRYGWVPYFRIPGDVENAKKKAYDKTKGSEEEMVIVKCVYVK